MWCCVSSAVVDEMWVGNYSSSRAKAGRLSHSSPAYTNNLVPFPEEMMLFSSKADRGENYLIDEGLNGTDRSR